MLGLLLSACFASIRPSLIPEPNSISIRDGTWILDSTVQIQYDSSLPAAKEIADWAGQVMRIPTGFDLPISDKIDESKAIKLMKSSTQKGEEGYGLHVTDDSVVISASARSGFLYGIVTLMQLLPPEIYGHHTYADLEWSIPVCDIDDYPRFHWRGVMLDCSRHFFDVPAVKKIIDGLAMLKMNVFHWHLTDDNGWRIEIKKYPNFTNHGSISPDGRPHPWYTDNLDNIPYAHFYTQEEVKDVIQYAKKLGITVVPEIEMPGHSLAGVASYPEISCRGVGPLYPLSKVNIGSEEVYCPGNDRTLEILRDVLDEVIDLFESEYIHIGGDECVKTRWKECSKCQKRMKDENLNSYDQLQSWFVQKMADYIESKGRHLIGWDEILEGGLAQGAAVMSWRGTSGGIAAAQMGHNVVMAPSTYYYLDHFQFGGKDIFQYNCCLKPLYHGYTYDPLAEIPEEAHRYIMGVQGNMWTEYVWGGEWDIQYKIFPRASAISEVGWTQVSSKNWMRFLSSTVRAMEKRFEIAEIHGAPVCLGKRAKWAPYNLSTEYQTLTWDITGAVQVVGTYQCAFIFTAGSNELKVKNVMLFYGDDLVSYDEHEGIVSWEETGSNLWDLKVDRDIAQGQRCYLRADVVGATGTDSYGQAVVFNTGSK